MDKIKLFFEKLLIYIKNLYIKIKNYLLSAEHRKQNLTIIGTLIFLNVLLLNSYISYGYYNDYSSFVLVHSKVGSAYQKDADYVMQVYLENKSNLGNYILGESIPMFGYTYSGYNCTNASTLVYDENLKVARTTATNKDVCSLYFDSTVSSDVDVLVKIEDGYNTNSYKSSNYVPHYGYTYSKVECVNGSTGTYNTTSHYLELNSTSKDTCTVYFNKDNTNNLVNLYLETANQSGTYIKRNGFIKEKNYQINESKSTCKNMNDETVSTTITYNNGIININTNNVICDVYMDDVNG